MANTIRLRRGSTAPTAGSFVEGEPAWDSTNKKLYVKAADGTMAQVGASGVSDGDKGDITVSASGATWTIDNQAVTYAKLQNVSATDKLLGRSTAGAGSVEEITCTAAGRALIDDADAAAQRTTLGLGTLATQSAVGNISNAGAIGSTANLPIITTTSGVLTTGTFGTTANAFCQGNDSRLSDTRTPTDGTVTDAKVASNAAIAFSKLATLTSGNILVGNASNVAASVAVTGDVTITNAGVTSIAAKAVTAGDIADAGLYSITTTAVSKTLANRERCTVTAATQTITLPASPAAGWEVTVTIGGTFTDTVVARNGSNIMSLAENMTIDKTDRSVTFYYVDATRGWRII